MRSLRLILILLALATPASATTYYVDFVGGADANNGTAKGTAWKNAPGMLLCASICASTTINGDDQIIFKGGVTWTAGEFGWTLKAGTSGHPVVYTVDQTWYTGGSWTRPILDLGGAMPTTTAMVQLANNVTFDNFELKGLSPNTASPTYCTIYVYICGNNQANFEIKNIYVHGWSYAANSYQVQVLIGDSHIPNQNTNSSFHDSVIDGGDSTPNPGVSGECVYGGPPVIYNVYCGNTSNGFIVNAPTLIHDNLIENIGRSAGAGDHLNGFESNCQQTLYFYNNVVRHINLNLAGSMAPAGVNVWFAPVATYTTYVYNNVFYDPGSSSNVFDIGSANQGCPGQTDGGNVTAYNNTQQAPGTGWIAPSASATLFTVENNHFICDTLNCITTGSGLTSTTNTQQTLTTANNQGYTSGQAYAYSPTAGGSTILAGTNLTSSCSGSLTALCSDTTYGIIYNTSNHTVTSPGRTSAARPNSTWDTGAYMYSSPAVNSNTQIGTGESVGAGMIVK